MNELYQKFISDIEINYPKHKDKILDALNFATKSHNGIVRRSGDPYIVHPIAVAKILIDNQMDYSTVIAGLLHDVVEDTEISLEEISKRYGKTVAKLVDGVTKIDKITAEKENRLQWVMILELCLSSLLTDCIICEQLDFYHLKNKSLFQKKPKNYSSQ